MAGTKQFDETAAIDAALDVFWRNGYEGTSLPMLEAATGLRRGSLYNAFGSKEGIYQQAVKRYADREVAPLAALLDDPAPRRGVERMLLAMVEATAEEGRPRGCLYTVGCSAGASAPAAVPASSAYEIRALEEAVRVAVVRAQKAGSLPASVDPRVLAQYVVSTSMGIMVLDQAGYDPEALRGVVETAMAGWDVQTS